MTPDASVSSATSVVYTVTFDTAVTGVDASDFAITTTGGAQAATPVVVIPQSSSTYRVTINGIQGNGSLRLDLIDNDSILDTLNGPLGGPGPGNGSFEGQVYLTPGQPRVLS